MNGRLAAALHISGAAHETVARRLADLREQRTVEWRRTPPAVRTLLERIETDALLEARRAAEALGEAHAEPQGEGGEEEPTWAVPA